MRSASAEREDRVEHCARRLVNRRERCQRVAMHAVDDALVPVVVELVDESLAVEPIEELDRQLDHARLRQVRGHPGELEIDR